MKVWKVSSSVSVSVMVADMSESFEGEDELEMFLFLFFFFLSEGDEITRRDELNLVRHSLGEIQLP